MVNFEDNIQGSISFYNHSTAQFRLLWTIKKYEEVRRRCDRSGYISVKLPVNFSPNYFTLGVNLYPNGHKASSEERVYTSVFIRNEGTFSVWVSYSFAVISGGDIHKYFRSSGGATKLESKAGRGFTEWFPTNIPEEENETLFPNGCLQIMLEGMVWFVEPLDKEKHLNEFRDGNIGSALTLYQSATHTDAILSVGEKQFQVHKNILSAKSSVFQEMFAEKSQNIIVIPDTREEVFREVINFLYTNTVTAMIDTMLSEVIRLAKKYQLNYLVEICQFKMLENISVDNCLEYLQVADSWGLKDLKEKSLKYITENRKLVFESEHWNVFKLKSCKLHMELLEMFMTVD